MVNPSLTKALLEVRDAVRLKILLQRHNIRIEDLPRMYEEGQQQGLSAPLLTHPKSEKDFSVFVKKSLEQAMEKEACGEAAPAGNWLTRDMRALWSLATASYINLLLLVIPFALASEGLGWSAQTTFILNFVSLVPLALILGDVTEDLAMRFGNIIGGLLNATFGNIVELILSISALEKGLYTVVATSLVGSILSNLLLVLGCCFLFGGMYYKIQRFNATSNRTCSALLLLASIGVAIPSTAGHLIKTISDDEVMWISRGAAIILLFCYLAYLYFQLFTHVELFDEAEDDEAEEGGEHGAEDEGSGYEEPLLSTTAAVLALATISILVAVHSGFLTGSIQEVSTTTGLGQAFLGMIVLPIAGNACEHMAAVIVAMKNKMDLSLGIALGSSLQIALGVLPITVLVGWATGHAMSLDLDLFIVVALVLSVIHTNLVTADATSHWLMGISLLAVYCLIALAYFFE